MQSSRVELETKSSNPSESCTSNYVNFFSPSKVPTLKMLASIELISQLASVNEVEKWLTKDPIAGLHDDILIVLTQIKKLHLYVEENKVEEADKLLQAAPAHLLPILLKTKGTIKTNAKGVNNNVIAEGTALMIALGSEAVGRDGCDLHLMQFNACVENTTQKKINLIQQ